MNDTINTSNSNVTDDELIRQALIDQAKDIREASKVFGEDLPALSQALCDVVNTLKKL